MKDDLKGQLDALFADSAQRQRRAEIARDTEADLQAAFVEEFKVKRDVVFVPALQEFANYIAGYGWKTQLKILDERPPQNDYRGKVTPPAKSAEVGLEFHRGSPNAGYQERWPHFTIVCEKAKRKVLFFESTIGPGHGGSSRSSGDMNLDELNADTLQAKLMKYFKKLVGDSRPYDER